MELFYFSNNNNFCILCIKNQSKNNWLSNRLFFCLQSIDRKKKMMYYQIKVTGYLTGYKNEKENVTCQANGKG